MHALTKDNTMLKGESKGQEHLYKHTYILLHMLLFKACNHFAGYQKFC